MTSLREAWGLVAPADYDAHMAGVGQAQANAELVPFLLRVEPPPGPRLLFVGAGTGQMFDFAALDFLRPFTVTFTDVSASLLARLTERLAAHSWPDHEEIVDDVENTRLSGPCDGVVIVLVLEHVVWRKAIRSLGGLSPARWYVVIQENPPGMAAAITPAREPVGTMRAIREARPTLVPRAELIAEMEALGYAVRATESRAVPDGKTMAGFVFSLAADARTAYDPPSPPTGETR